MKEWGALTDQQTAARNSIGTARVTNSPLKSSVGSRKACDGVRILILNEDNGMFYIEDAVNGLQPVVLLLHCALGGVSLWSMFVPGHSPTQAYCL